MKDTSELLQVVLTAVISGDHIFRRREFNFLLANHN
jgi:hypothetical protein